MFSKVDSFLFNTTVKGFGAGYLGLSLSLFVYSWKQHNLDEVWPLAIIELVVGIGILGASHFLTISQERLKLSNAVLKNSADDLPVLLGGLGGCFKFLLFGGSALSSTMIVLSLRMGYYALSNISLHEFCRTTETVFFTNCILPMVGLLGIATLLCLTLLTSVFALLSRKWRFVVQSSTNDQAIMSALDKLTTMELFYKKINKADAYSLRLLALAERNARVSR